jgi:hypothetical protein
MYKLIIITVIITILYLLYLLYTSDTENFNSFNDNNILSIQKRYNKIPLIQSEDLIITNTLNLDNVNSNTINFDVSYNIKNNNDKLIISSANNKINFAFDLSGNCDISDNQSNQQILNTFIKNIQTNNLNLNKKIKFPMQNRTNLNQVSVQNDISINDTIVDNTTQNIANNTTGIRIWKQQMYRISCKESLYNSNGEVKGCKTFQFGDIKLVDEGGVQYDSDKWIVIAVGHQFISGNVTGVFTYVYNKKWYGGCGNQGYTGTFMAIPLNYFNDINLDSFAGIYSGFPYS